MPPAWRSELARAPVRTRLAMKSTKVVGVRAKNNRSHSQSHLAATGPHDYGGGAPSKVA